MNAVLWLVQILLAAVFAAHGLFLLFPPSAEMLAQMNAAMSTEFRVFLGVAEVLAAVGLTLPGVTRILPWLVPAAAVGLMVVMVSASVYHLRRGEVGGAATTIVLLVLATFVAYMRFRVRPIPARTNRAA